MVFIESVVISQAIGKFDIDRRIACLHQFKVHQQTPGSAVTVNKWVNALKFNMEPCKLCNDVFVTL